MDTRRAGKYIFFYSQIITNNISIRKEFFFLMQISPTSFFFPTMSRTETELGKSRVTIGTLLKAERKKFASEIFSI